MFSLRYSIWQIGRVVITWQYPYWFLRMMFDLGLKCCEQCGTWTTRLANDSNPSFDCEYCIWGEPFMQPISVWQHINWQAIGAWIFILGYIFLMTMSTIGMLE